VQIFTLLSFLATTFVLLGVGVRMLWVAAHTRRVPECSFGITLVGGALGGVGLVFAGGRLTGEQGPFWLWAAALFSMALGMSALYVGVWRIYRPGTRWGLLLAVGGILLALAAMLMRTLPGEIAEPHTPSPGLLLFRLAGLGAYAWAAVEASRYWGMMRRRCALGLAEPLVTQQFLLWGVAATAAALNTPLLLSAAYVLHAPLVELPYIFLPLQINMLISSFGLWFAFFPPAFYRRRFESGAVVS
jgi:hypothetical protein